MWENVIKEVRQITIATVDYKLENDNPFYIYLLQLTDESPSAITISGRCSINKENVDIPFTANQWNPVLIKSLNVTQKVLDNFKVLIGLNYSTI